jgi:hypothetical protein
MTVSVDMNEPAVEHGPGVGLVVRCTTHRSRTYLDYAADDGIRTVCIDRLPDAEAADRLRRSLRQVVSVRFDARVEGVDCVVRGIGHRIPRAIPVPVAAGLGLVRVGLAGLVVQHGEG